MKYVVVILGILLIIVALTLIIMTAVKKYLSKLIDKRIERFQSELLEKQIVETQNMYKQVRGWRHDYRNHIQNMKIQLHEENYQALDSYLDELVEDLNTVDTVIKTGNVMADAILNSKLSISEELNAKINVKANIPQNLKISDVELCSILGNLLDNANEACEKASEQDRFIRVYMGTLKGQFYLSVQNCATYISKKDGKYLSVKSGEHGFGLFRIDRITTKHGGYVNRQDEDGIFATEIMLPL